MQNIIPSETIRNTRNAQKTRSKNGHDHAPSPPPPSPVLSYLDTPLWPVGAGLSNAGRGGVRSEGRWRWNPLMLMW